MKELLLYGSLYGENVTNIITGLDQANGDACIRISSGGGSPEDTFGIIAKMKEFKGNLTVKVDGKAFSSACFFLAYADNVEALDVSEFMIHRAGYSEYFEASSEMFTDELKGNLKRINDSLRTALEAKIDVKAFERIAKTTMDQIFSMEGRPMVFLNAKQAKQIGLVDSINKITPKMRAEIESFVEDSFQGSPKLAAEFLPKASQEPESKIDTKMTVEELKTKHPEVFNAVFKAGVDEERDRVGAWLGFVDVDAKKVVEAVKKGDKMSQTEMVEMLRADAATKGLDAAKKDGEEAGAAGTPEAEEKTAEEQAEAKAKADFMAELNGELNLNQEKK